MRSFCVWLYIIEYYVALSYVSVFLCYLCVYDFLVRIYGFQGDILWGCVNVCGVVVVVEK